MPLAPSLLLSLALLVGAPAPKPPTLAQDHSALLGEWRRASGPDRGRIVLTF